MTKVAKQLLDVLSSLDESPRFCTSGSIASVLPGLEVQAVGGIGLPVNPVQARQLIQHAAQAPYGRGEDTVVDTEVRRVWQIEPGQFVIKNPDWDAFIAALVKAVKQEFSIDKTVKWELYKLLIYEEGSFFTPHRDSEKLDGMFATLVVCLPSQHQGGTLIVQHDGESEEIDFSDAAQAYNTQYAAFYADCQHEIKPITSGYRVCLVYNLTVAQRKRQPSAPRNSEQVAKAASPLVKLFTDSSLDKVAIPLAHEYSQAGLHPDLLKGTDRSLMEVLARAAEQLGYQLNLALMTYYQTGDIDYDSVDYGNRWSSPDYDDADIGEIYEESVTLDYWVDAQGQQKAFGAMQLAEDEILSATAIDEFPTDQEVHEATGNEGVTMERWYRYAAIVLWPRDNYFRILAGEGQASALPALAELIDGTKKPSSSEQCRAFAEEIINRWRPPRYFTRNNASKSADMLTQLQRIADPALANRFIREILSVDYSGTEGKPLSKLCNKLGWKESAPALTQFVAAQLPSVDTASLGATVSIFKDLCCSAARLTKERLSTCRVLASELLKVVAQWDGYKEKDTWSYRSETREGIVDSLFAALDAIEEPALLEQFLSHVLNCPKHYGLHKVLIPAAQKTRQNIERKSPTAAQYQRLLKHCSDALQSLTATPVEVPTDWVQDVKLGCKCTDCKELQQFLLDPGERIHRFRVRKDRRQHLHQQIDKHRCDVDHVTERKGSPQTLVCTKNRASYKRKQKQFETDTRLLTELRQIAGAC